MNYNRIFTPMSSDIAIDAAEPDPEVELDAAESRDGAAVEVDDVLPTQGDEGGSVANVGSVAGPADLDSGAEVNNNEKSAAPNFWADTDNDCVKFVLHLKEKVERSGLDARRAEFEATAAVCLRGEELARNSSAWEDVIGLPAWKEAGGARPKLEQQKDATKFLLRIYVGVDKTKESSLRWRAVKMLVSLRVKPADFAKHFETRGGYKNIVASGRKKSNSGNSTGEPEGDVSGDARALGSGNGQQAALRFACDDQVAEVMNRPDGFELLLRATLATGEDGVRVMQLRISKDENAACVEAA